MKMVGTGAGGWDVPRSTWGWQFDRPRRPRHPRVRRRVAQVLGRALAVRPGRGVMAWIGRTEVAPEFTMDAPSTVMWQHKSGLRGVWDITLAPDMLMRSDYYSNDERFEVTGTLGSYPCNHCTSHGLQQPCARGVPRRRGAPVPRSRRRLGLVVPRRRPLHRRLRTGSDYLWNGTTHTTCWRSSSAPTSRRSATRPSRSHTDPTTVRLAVTALRCAKGDTDANVVAPR